MSATTEQVWKAIDANIFGVLAFVNAKGEPRSAGIWESTSATVCGCSGPRISAMYAGEKARSGKGSVAKTDAY